MADSVKPSVTAGMRGAGWDAHLMKRASRTTPYALVTADKNRTLGFLFTASGQEKTVVSIMHPRELAVAHYMVPWILEAGCACWVQAPRSVGNDLRLEHEIALFDVAAGMQKLRELEFENIVLLGNSGGAGLYSFYNQQSRLAPESRIAKTPGGRPTRLSELDMSIVDGLIFLSPHPGQGKLLMSGIDPSVVDESDPMLSDSALDPFIPENGFDLETNQGCYSSEFVKRYRAAQVKRVGRIDARARELLSIKRDARTRAKSGSASIADRRLGSHAPIFQVWRTDADLRSWDVSIDPSDRKPGSLWARDPFISNWGSVAFARTVTPESWLSTWSGQSSNASLEKTAGSISQPTLLVEYTGDQCTFPSDIQTIFSQIGGDRKAHVRVRGNHHGMALSPDEEPGQVVAARHIIDWLSRTMA